MKQYCSESLQKALCYIFWRFQAVIHRPWRQQCGTWILKKPAIEATAYRACETWKEISPLLLSLILIFSLLVFFLFILLLL